MSRMIILTSDSTYFYPNGLTGKEYRFRKPFPAMLGYEQILADEGGEFQMWGRRAGEPPGRFAHEILRENDNPLVARFVRWCFGKMVGKMERRVE